MLFLRIIIVIVILSSLGIIFCYWIIKWAASSLVYQDTKELDVCDLALILGTAKFTQKGGLNLYYKYRMEAAQLLFQKKKVNFFIVSGAGKYDQPLNEAEEMKWSLVSRGVPESAIITDEAGYRTWDSLWQCRNTFHYQHVLVVSQRFHIERAIFIGRHYGMEIRGFAAKNVKGKIAVKMFLRECLARVKCLLDCYLIHPIPVYLKKGQK